MKGKFWYQYMYFKEPPVCKPLGSKFKWMLLAVLLGCFFWADDYSVHRSSWGKTGPVQDLFSITHPVCSSVGDTQLMGDFPSRNAASIKAFSLSDMTPWRTETEAIDLPFNMRVRKSSDHSIRQDGKKWMKLRMATYFRMSHWTNWACNVSLTVCLYGSTPEYFLVSEGISFNMCGCIMPLHGVKFWKNQIGKFMATYFCTGLYLINKISDTITLYEP